MTPKLSCHRSVHLSPTPREVGKVPRAPFEPAWPEATQRWIFPLAAPARQDWRETEASNLPTMLPRTLEVGRAERAPNLGSADLSSQLSCHFYPSFGAAMRVPGSQFPHPRQVVLKNKRISTCNAVGTKTGNKAASSPEKKGISGPLSLLDLTAVKVKVTQSCPTLCNPVDYRAMEFSRPEYWSW